MSWCRYCGGDHRDRDCPDEQEGMATDIAPWSAGEKVILMTLVVVVIALATILVTLALRACA